MEATITYANGTEIIAEKNGDCFIVNTKPSVTLDLSTVTIEDEDGSRVYNNAELIECASIDGRYWFAFRELSPLELQIRELENVNQMLTDCLLEISELLYS